MPEIEVRDSCTGYLVPARDGSRLLPDWESSWDAAAVVAAVILGEHLKIQNFDKTIQNVQMAISTISTHPKLKCSKKTSKV